MNNNVELKDEISFDEYKAWLTGLLHGKGNKLPDINDWRSIKNMIDKVVPDVMEVQNPTPYYAPTPYVEPEPLPWQQTQPTCGTAGQDGDNITITSDAPVHMYQWDTSKYNIIPTEEAQLAHMTELSFAQELCIKLMDDKRKK